MILPCENSGSILEDLQDGFRQCTRPHVLEEKGPHEKELVEEFGAINLLRQEHESIRQMEEVVTFVSKGGNRRF